MRVLYHVTLSPFARKVRIVLAEKNLEFTLKLEKVGNADRNSSRSIPPARCRC